MLRLHSTVLIPLLIKRKNLVAPVMFFVGSLMAMMFIPGVASFFIEDEKIFLIVLLLDVLIMLPIFIIAAIVVIRAALKNSVFKYIPDAPAEALSKMDVVFDFDSEPGKLLFKEVAPEVIDRTKPSLTLYENGKVRNGAERFFKISELSVNHNYRLAMFLRMAVGVIPGGMNGVTSTMQVYWYIFLDEEYDKLMSAIRGYNIRIKTKMQNDRNAKYIVDGIRARNGLFFDQGERIFVNGNYYF